MNTFLLNMYELLSYTIYCVHQVEYVIHTLVAVSQEYVNIYSTPRLTPLFPPEQPPASGELAKNKAPPAHSPTVAPRPS